MSSNSNLYQGLKQSAHSPHLSRRSFLWAVGGLAGGGVVLPWVAWGEEETKGQPPPPPSKWRFYLGVPISGNAKACEAFGVDPARGIFYPSEPVLGKIYDHVPKRNEAVIEYSVRHLGEKVGDGICGTFVRQVIQSTGSVPKNEGRVIYSAKRQGSSVESIGNPDAICPGDIYRYRIIKNNKIYPEHCGVIWNRLSSATTYVSLEQNFNGIRFVVARDLYMDRIGNEHIFIIQRLPPS